MKVYHPETGIFLGVVYRGTGLWWAEDRHLRVTYHDSEAEARAHLLRQEVAA